ncbi:TrbI/VirB10 family protein [Candidatus Anaplasma sp. TIGMIC]|uniref:TrbI/VirB10 family protein n=1 Tax=Candidatus Anaplasma sp. TIGMIC TaxID=3020713 RepID=UPI00232CA88A|nr:TrbI/VirB10 family protein [Candidatus Anaplasma sp. TIGMIC]MDB1135276.1 TrbI/VirB10 family protein [Candidatus Anaplasma sp. TIGMIC]
MSDDIKGAGAEENIEDDVNIVGVHKSKKLFVTIIVLFVTGALYYVFFMGEKPAEVVDETKKSIEERNVEKLLKDAESPAQETTPRILTPPPRLPELPPLVMPSVPDIPVVTKLVKPPVGVEDDTTELEVPTTLEDNTPKDVRSEPLLPMPYSPMTAEKMPSFLGYDKEKRGAPMIALGGGDSGGGDESGTGGEGDIDKRFTAWHGLEGTSSPSVKATHVGDPRYIILQGHMIDAVLETAINSDIPGVLRAIVSRDVYAAAGNAVMIPKGSRLIGSYFFDDNGKSMRVNVNWTRVILPHGVDVQINSTGTDELGRNGISGVFDSKVGATLTSTILLAGINIGTAVVSSKIPALQSEVVKTEEDKDKKTTSSSSVQAKIVTDAVKDFSESMKALINKYTDTTPTVYVDQGTVMRVFVNQDIVFPREAVLR